MSISELFFITVPIAWLLWVLFVVKNESPAKFLFQWGILLIACLVLSYFMNQRLSGMMGGRWAWGEVVYYGWLLFAFFAIFRIFRKILESILPKMIHRPFNEKIRKRIIKSAYYLILFVTVIPFFLAMTTIHRAKIGDAFNPKTELGIAYEEVSLRTKDGLNIKGWFIPAQSDKAVIIAHGLGANKSNFIGTVDMWHQLNFNVLIFDFRGHGRSDGHTITLGYKERLDVMAGLNYLMKQKKFTQDKIIGYGVSFGGASMILAANEMRVFHKMIIDSSFASLDDMANTVVDGEVIIPKFSRSLFKEIGLFFVRLDLGFDIRDHSPENIVGHLAGTPILFIHGKGDPLINWMQTKRLYERAGDPKQVVFLETQGHFGTPNDSRYMEIIRTFVEN